MFEIENSKQYKIYFLKKQFEKSVFKIFRYFIYILFFIALTVLFLNLIGFYQVSKMFIGFALLIVSIALILFMIEMYVKYAINYETLASKDKKDIFSMLSEEALELFYEHIVLYKKYQNDPNDLSVLVFALSNTKKGRYFLIRSAIVFSEDIEKLALTKIKQKNTADSKTKKIFINFLENAYKLANNNSISFENIVKSLYQNNLFFKHLLEEKNLSQQDMENILNWTKRSFLEYKKLKIWQKDYYVEGIGRDWAYGYTPVLNEYSFNISQFILNSYIEYQSKVRLQIVSEMEDILAKSGNNNILLIGDPGVGKKTVVNSLAQKIIKGQTYESLKYKNIVQLDLPRLLSSKNSENIFIRIFSEASRAGNIIIYIDNLVNLISSYSKEIGTIDATKFLIPFLNSPNICIIGSISKEDYIKKLQANTIIEPLFTKIEINELKKEEVMPSIEHLIGYVENKHKIVFTYNSIKHLIEIADRYIHDEPFPQKAVDLITQLGVQVEKSKKTIVEIEDVDALIVQKIKIPVGQVKQSEKQKLLNLENILHKRVIGQDEAINAVANSLRRSRAGLKKGAKPIGSFLFIGPTGVGKTETAKALAEAYYGSEKNIIRFDMSEFQQIKSIDQLIGYVANEEFIPGRLTQSVRNNPYSLVLFDEIEKAHLNILNLFLQILDEGKITDASGREIIFTNTIIIATSNAGSEKIREYLKENAAIEKLGDFITDYLLKQGIFRPEFLNRFDKVVCYKPLTEENVFLVVKLMIENIKKTLKEKKIGLEFDDNAIKKIIDQGYDPVFGARSLNRLIQEKVENVLAKKMLSEELKENDVCKITENDV